MAHPKSGLVCDPVQSPVCLSGTEPVAWEVDALSLLWQELDAYAFPVAILGQLVTKLLEQGCLRMILIALGWPNMPWFWDLVKMSVQIPLSPPRVEKLLTQPFNECPHRDLITLNLHAWFLEPQPFNKRVSLTKWQQELKLLRDIQPETSVSQSFVRWCEKGQMDFRSPSIKQIADFLLYLFQVKLLQLSTIEG